MTTLVYGFGSYFQKKDTFNDIDILIVHLESDEASCHEAISLKNSMKIEMPIVDISILSKSAEIEFNFINKSRAALIYKYDNKHTRQNVVEIVKIVNSFRKT